MEKIEKVKKNGNRVSGFLAVINEKVFTFIHVTFMFEGSSFLLLNDFNGWLYTVNIETRGKKARWPIKVR